MSEEQAKIVEIKEGLSDANHELIYITDMFKEHVIHDWMECLLAEIDRLQDELQSAQQEIKRLEEKEDREMWDTWKDDITELKTLRQKEQKLIEELHWYADKDNHAIAHAGGLSKMYYDKGERARTALKWLGVME